MADARDMKAYQSDSFKGPDFVGRTTQFLITGVTTREIGMRKEQLLTLDVEGDERYIVVSNPVFNEITENWGSETDAWVGCTIECYAKEGVHNPSKGKVGPAVRVNCITAAEGASPNSAPTAPAAQSGETDTDSDIPF